jgi:NAD(P)-dependent dehydrogenase (short-subunit alcohol dehydrogenase family)
MGADEARLFSQEGAKVAIADVLEDDGRKVEAEINESGGECIFVKLDVTSESDWQNAIKATTSRFGKLNILVNNAGIGGAGGQVADTTLEDWNRVMEINSTGVFLGCKTAIPEMQKAGGGSIVNISSQLGLVGTDNSSPQYHASKGSVRLLTKATAVQYARDRIRCNSVHPGPVVTQMTERHRSDPARYDLMKSRIPMGRFAEPREIANAVLFLASDESSFMTGSELVVDGGWTAQ